MAEGSKLYQRGGVVVGDGGSGSAIAAVVAIPIDVAVGCYPLSTIISSSTTMVVIDKATNTRMVIGIAAATTTAEI